MLNHRCDQALHFGLKVLWHGFPTTSKESSRMWDEMLTTKASPTDGCHCLFFTSEMIRADRYRHNSLIRIDSPLIAAPVLLLCVVRSERRRQEAFRFCEWVMVLWIVCPIFMFLWRIQIGARAQSEAYDSKWKWSTDMGTSVQGEYVGPTTKLVHQRWRLLLPVSTSGVTSVLNVLRAFISHHNWLYLLSRSKLITRNCALFIFFFDLKILFSAACVSLTAFFAFFYNNLYLPFFSFSNLQSSSSLSPFFPLVVIIFSMFKGIGTGCRAPKTSHNFLCW